jgi:hypothetical protein
MKFILAAFLGLVVSFGSFAKSCDGDNLNGVTPSKLLVYHTDKGHKTVDSTHPISFDVSHEEFSDSETLYHLSHGKSQDKTCKLYVHKDSEKFSLKQKENILVKSAEFTNGQFIMKLDHKNLSSIVCTGVKTMGDLKDVMEPYLMYNCKDKVAYQRPAGTTDRLPASAK